LSAVVDEGRAVMKTAIYLRREIDYVASKHDLLQFKRDNAAKVENLNSEISLKSHELMSLLEVEDCDSIDELKIKIERKKQVFILETVTTSNSFYCIHSIYSIRH
jgi:hypothetical protein